MKTESVKLPVRWKDDSEAVPGVVGNIIDASGVIIAVCCTPQTGDQIARALNTQPQLLEACKEAVAQIVNHESGHHRQFVEVYEILKSAIAAAEKEKV